MKYLSVCSGIEAASVAWHPLGWECVAVAEIEPFPCAVLKHHYPNVPNLGDVTQITEQQIKALGHIDAVAMGFPCQDVSVAGQRKGLQNADGTLTRSGLFFDAMRIVEWAQSRWLIGENVPGLFSTNGGRDFAAVVGELAGIALGVPDGGWENSGAALGPRGLVEWAVLDAQYFGLAQRRERIFFVRDSGDWTRRPPVLLIPESLQGNPPPSREARKDVTGTLSARSSGGGGLGTDFDLAGGVVHAANVPQSEVARCLNSGGMGRIDWETETFVTAPAGGVASALRAQAQSAHAADLETYVTHSLRGKGFDASEDGTGRGTPITPVYAIQERAVRLGTQVRRLTPTECERLQGFPDGYTKIPWNGWRNMDASETPDGCRELGLEVRQTKKGKWRVKDVDGPRYKALGNSWPVPVIVWLGKRIEMVDAL